ncbi:MAG: molybdenum cofactor guanylyltransferase MobA [Methylophilales bacterium 28-44-11]|jgi:molybdopterin-guanine dinucleotide biosynthesis protein A|nr:MAG: molybdenum cofactor guanylyltransferase MobA [Methylophilales bacterium 28-44-11]
MTISAVILCGGRATRMGGIDKGLVSLHGKPLVQHVIERVQPQVSEIFINANRELSVYQSFGFPVISDVQADFIGPLAGFYIGMLQANHPYLFTVPCDVPYLPNNITSRLLQALTESSADIAVAKSDGHAHPVISLCKTSTLPSLKSSIELGMRKVSAWQQSLHYIEVNFDDIDAFTNLNTLDDLAQLEKSV